MDQEQQNTLYIAQRKLSEGITFLQRAKNEELVEPVDHNRIKSLRQQATASLQAAQHHINSLI